jgi:hypothetical protein
VNASVTGWVTPCMVRLPVAAYEVAPDLVTLLETKSIVGYSATLKKSALSR